VDSLWVRKPSAEIANYLQLKDDVESATGFDISFEGKYKWVAFLPSKASAAVPVPNRYFGLFEDGSIKVRGIEVRRHDTPEFFAKCQAEVLKTMARGDTEKQVRELMPEVDAIFDKYADALRSGRVPLDELLFTKQLSKASSEYSNRKTVEVDAVRQLEAEGRRLKAGEVIRYVITDYRAKHGPRSVPEELIEQGTAYDAPRYVELLAKVCDSLTLPFGHYVMAQIRNRAQLTLLAY
jgi:DNA polymerase-2